MKNLKNILTLFFFITINFVFSQQVIKPIESLVSDKEHENPNTYYMDGIEGNLQACVGTWIYDNGTDYFKAVITKSKVLYGEKYNIYIDQLFIKYEYRKNGIWKYYNTSPFNIPAGANTQASDITSASVKNNRISFYYDEPSFTSCRRRKTGFLELQLMSGATNQLQWSRTTDTRYFNSWPCSDGTPLDDSAFIIPANMILVKQ